MTTFIITYEVVVDAETEDEAVEESKQLLARGDFEPSNIETDDDDG